PPKKHPGPRRWSYFMVRKIEYTRIVLYFSYPCHRRVCFVRNSLVCPVLVNVEKPGHGNVRYRASIGSGVSRTARAIVLKDYRVAGEGAGRRLYLCVETSKYIYYTLIL